MRVPPTKSTALDVGTIWHQAMFAKEEHLNINEVLSKIEASPEAWEEWRNTLEKALPFVKFMDGEVGLGSEVELEIPDFVGKIPLKGRLDRIVKWNGKIYHRQYKTLAASKPISVFMELQRTDWHECGYHAMLETKYPLEEIGGTILYIARKMSKTFFNKESPELALVYPPPIMTRRSNVIDEAFNTMQRVGKNIINAVEHGLGEIDKHPHACGGPNQNSMCPYRNVCFGNLSIGSDAFITVENRYPSQGE
jgi:hypothetical protein